MSIFYLDAETVGFHGMPVLLQYAKDEGEIYLHNIWNERIDTTLELIEEIISHDICGFNLTFDFFHLCKLYTTLSLYPDKSVYPEDVVDELGVLEEQARFCDICLKPKRALDIMLVARKGPYQSLMERDDIKIRRVPTPIAWNLAQELEKRIQFDDIYFAKAKDKFAPRWKVYDILKPDGTSNPDFKDIKLKFKASGALKTLYRHAFKITEEVFTFRDVAVDRKFLPREVGYAPYALGVPNLDSNGKQTSHPLKDTYHIDRDWRGTWPEVLKQHTLHWYYNKDARKYAGDDVHYTRRLHLEHFDAIEPGDKDSTLACAVAACRWKGFAVNIPRIKELKAAAALKSKAAPRDHRAVKRYITKVMDETELLALQGSTKRVILEEIAEWMADDGTKHPAATRAVEVLDARKAEKEEEVYDKILMSGRLHASNKITGTLSNRMSGDNGLNPQGIKHDTYVRAAFTLADNDEDLLKLEHPQWDKEQITKSIRLLCGGDFKGFEVTIALKVFDDKWLTSQVLSGKKVHALMAMELFPGKTYDEILKSEGTANDMYDKGKKGFFLKVYFGNAYTIHTKLGIPMETAEKADLNFNKKAMGVKAFQDAVIKDFSALQQPGGIGSKVEWHQPLDYSESFFGFKRYFTLENRITRALFDMAQDPPPSIKNAKLKVIRRDRIQTAGGAVQSALYAAAFAISSRNVRAAGNHKIQNPGAEITKALQENLWTLQPVGVHSWIIQPLNIHDEIMAVTKPGYEAAAEQKANETVAEYKKYVPLLAIDWFTDISDWASKKGKKDVAGIAKRSLQSVA